MSTAQKQTAAQKRAALKESQREQSVRHDAVELCAKYLLAGSAPDFVAVRPACGTTVRAWGLHRMSGGVVAVTDSQGNAAHIENADRWAWRLREVAPPLADESLWWLRDQARELTAAIAKAVVSGKRGF